MSSRREIRENLFVSIVVSTSEEYVIARREKERKMTCGFCLVNFLELAEN
jgi:hypothetical protein